MLESSCYPTTSKSVLSPQVRALMVLSGETSLLFTLLLISCYALTFSTAIDFISSTQYLQDPGSISSNGSVFTMGFFSPNGSNNRYVGIWYDGYPVFTPVWVANREKPITDSSGAVTVSEDGNLEVRNGKNETLWSSNVTSTGQGNVIARLLDSGNLMITNSNMGETDPIWESFRHVSNSYLPKMEFSSNARTNESITFTSWKSPSDPAPGNFSMYLDPLNIPQVYLMKGTRPFWRSGPWNSRIFIGISRMESVYLNGFSLQDDKEGTFSLVYTYDRPYITYYFLDPNGTFSQVYWDEEGKNRGVSWSSYETECDVYGKCGSFGICNPLKTPICSCTRGFKPGNLEEWGRGNWTSGCIRKTSLNCELSTINGTRTSGKDGFVKLETVKVPDFAGLWVSPSESHSPLEGQCSSWCLSNCSCVGYAYDAGIGCMIWSGDLIDLQKFPSGGASLYIRVPEQELADKSRDFKAITAMTLSSGAVFIALLSLFLCWLVRKRRVMAMKVLRKLSSGRNKSQRIYSGTRFQDNLKLQELKLLSFDELSTATDSFSSANKLGQGGFGPVYMGKLLDEQEIAVKRLSKASGQGLEEFMNEMVVISKVQHRNLVRLLGCCAEEDEKILVYEFMPNKSLDTFLFDPEKRKFLGWTKRFSIIDGICRGLLYLHRDSRLRIIHRDMKASNILLDEELTPKISDFGMARIFGVEEDEANTMRVVGTYGYMAPEYAMEGHFSEKSDVFSFGVLLLEIVSGRKNTSFSHDEESLSLLGLAWRLWNEGNVMALLDSAIADNSNPTEVLRCIHLGLLCTQELPRDRPTISTVILMLNSEITDLPTPKQPAFVERQMARYSPSFTHGDGMDSSNNITITTVGGR